MHFFRPRCLFALLVATLALSACAKEKANDVVEAAELPVPADQATEKERAQIASTVKEIESIAGELARPQKFQGLPILVTTEDMLEAKRAGACYFERGKGKFILVNRAVFEEEERLSAGGLQTTLFRVLLHEIGHCYLGRHHLETKISGQGRKLRYSREGRPARFQNEYFFSDYNVSSMESQSLLMPLALKRYYVAELLGLYRAATLDQLAELSGGETGEH